MLKKLGDYSQFLLLFSSVLYFFGFITVTSYFARFNISTFEIINSRYLIAGFYSFVFIGIAIFMSWQILEHYKFSEFLQRKNIQRRVLLLFLDVSSISLLSTFISNLINTAQIKPNLIQSAPQFDARFQFNFIGKLLEIIPLNMGSDNITYWTKIFLNFFIYEIVILGIYYLISNIHKSKDKAKVVKAKVASRLLNQASKVEAKHSEIFYFAWQLQELACITGSFILIGYSTNKLLTNLFDFNNLATSNISSNLIFSWFFVFITSIILFFYASKLTTSDFAKNFIHNTLDNPHNLANFIQMGILPVLSGLLFFGQVIYPRIPYTIGGGQARRVVLKTKDNSINFSSYKNNYLIGETTNFMYVASVNDEIKRVYQLNVNSIDYINTLEVHTATSAASNFQ